MGVATPGLGGGNRKNWHRCFATPEQHWKGSMFMTTVKYVAGLTALLGVLIGVAGARAAEEKPKPSQPHVVIIGVGEFKDPLITPRKFADDDARALYDLLTSKDHLGVDKDHV